MCRFALFIAGKSAARILAKENQLPVVKDMVVLAMERMSKYWEIPEEKVLQEIRESCQQFQAFQNQTRHAAWGTVVRSIHHWDVFLIEAGMQCFLNKNDPTQGYQLARDYCEKYDPSYGTGLIPDSVPFLEEVLGFWEWWKEGE